MEPSVYSTLLKIIRASLPYIFVIYATLFYNIAMHVAEGKTGVFTFWYRRASVEAKLSDFCWFQHMAMTVKHVYASWKHQKYEIITRLSKSSSRRNCADLLGTTTFLR